MNNYHFETAINESTDPLGTVGRWNNELRKWRRA
jgi:hypothetical protein